MKKTSVKSRKAQFRNEWKYYISLWDGQSLKERLGGVMQRDPYAENGIYMIRSLYFDDYWDSAYNEKIAGVDFRKKYRIRIYNCSDKAIKLERKLKKSNYIYKESASLTRQEYEWIMEGKYSFLLKHPDSLCREFYYECTVNIMRPKVIVDYEREPFILQEGNVRVTFDRDVRAAAPEQDIFNPGLASYAVVPFGRIVLEVKFTEFLPQYIKEALPAGEQEFSAISKYTLCYDRIYHRTDSLFLVSRSEKTW